MIDDEAGGFPEPEPAKVDLLIVDESELKSVGMPKRRSCRLGK